MGTVILNSGTSVVMEEVDGQATLQQLYEDVANEHYTDSYRTRLIAAWGKLKRQGWGILPYLHELTKSTNNKLVTAAKDAIKLIDPGTPSLDGINKDLTTFSPKVVSGSSSSGSPTGTRYNNNNYNRREKEFPVQNGHCTVWKKLERKKVAFTEVPVNGDLSEGTRVSGTCCFCEKNTLFPKNLRKASESIAGPKRLFCNFCLRNEFYKMRHRKHVLLMSFRGVIAYYYYCFHLVPKTATMYMMDLESYINLHVRLGTQNPLFRYDPESFLWFVDFSKVGNKPRQMPLDFVLETVVSILAGFDLYNNVKDASPAQFFQKYKEAITDFHHHRRRPAGQRILTPTLYGCGIPHETSVTKAIPINLLRNFTPGQLIENYKHKQQFRGSY